MNKKNGRKFKVTMMVIILLIIVSGTVAYGASIGNTKFSMMIESAAQKYKDVRNYKSFLGEFEDFTKKLESDMSVDEIKTQIINKSEELQKKYDSSTSIAKISNQITNVAINSTETNTTDFINELITKMGVLLKNTNLAIESLTPNVKVDNIASTTAVERCGEKYDTKLTGKIYYCKPDKNGKPVSNKWVYLVHGANMTGQAMADAVGLMYLEQGYNILATDSRSFENIEDDETMGYIESLDVWDWLTYLNNTYGDKCEEIIIHGISEGGIATIFASGLEIDGKTLKNQNVIGIVEDCGYIPSTDEETETEAKDEKLDKYPNALDSFKECELPVLIIHGTKDAIVPFENSTEIYNMARDNSKIPYVQRFNAVNEQHAFIVLGAKYNVYEGHIKNFIDKAEKIANGETVNKESNYQEEKEKETSAMTGLIKALKLIKNTMGQ